MTRRSAITVAVEVGAAVAATSVVVTMRLPASESLSASMAWTAVGLAAALVVLGLFNVTLPRGDTVDTTASLVFVAAAVLHDPLLAILLVAGSRIVVSVVQHSRNTVEGLLSSLARRTLLIAAVYTFFAIACPSIVQGLGVRPDASQIAFILAGAVALVGLDAVLDQVHQSLVMRVPIISLLASAVRLEGWILAAEMSTGALAVVMFPALQWWGLLTAVALLLVTRQSFALLIEVRASYTATVEVLARSLEAYDPGRRGHAERVAGMVASAGRHIGFQGKILENVTYAALFHDVGRLGADDESEASSADSAHVLESVGFLAGAVPILRVLDSAAEGNVSLDENTLIGAYLIATFSAKDASVSSGRSDDELRANAIGARLYAATRKNVDRIIERVGEELARQPLDSATSRGASA